MQLPIQNINLLTGWYSLCADILEDGSVKANFILLSDENIESIFLIKGKLYTVTEVSDYPVTDIFLEFLKKEEKTDKNPNGVFNSKFIEKVYKTRVLYRHTFKAFSM